jgi:ABC-type bacteriocin/lantibiotic exporter with double-glycine peptidase domain
VAACLRTVLSGFGVDISEAELRALCDTTIFGTTALKAVDAARALGFNGTAKHNLTMTELTALVDAGDYPIVFVNLLPISSKDAAHTYVVIEASAADITVYDPAHGERTLPLDTFRAAWTLMRYVTVIVAK